VVITAARNAKERKQYQGAPNSQQFRAYNKESIDLSQKRGGRRREEKLKSIEGEKANTEEKKDPQLWIWGKKNLMSRPLGEGGTGRGRSEKGETKKKE